MAAFDAKSQCCIPTANTDVKPASTTKEVNEAAVAELDMIALKGGWFRMGANDSPYPEDGEGPERDVFVNPFHLCATVISIDMFSRFIDATGYITLAERAGSSFVFSALCDPAQSYPAVAQTPWWRQVPGACWHSPCGPWNKLVVSADHPVTHIAHQDAIAYCHWSGSRLPTEAEWEYAARGPLVAKPFPWGDTLEQEGRHYANVWQGQFPGSNTEADGFLGTAPVNAFSKQGFGHYNMLGNVWEWVADRFTNLHSPRALRNPTGPLNGTRYVAKGGSYLCHASYCARYRTSSRQALPDNTTTGNLGFRVAKDQVRRFA